MFLKKNKKKKKSKTSFSLSSSKSKCQTVLCVQNLWSLSNKLFINKKGVSTIVAQAVLLFLLSPSASISRNAFVEALPQRWSKIKDENLNKLNQI